MKFTTPTPSELEDARKGHLRDIFADDLDVLFVGINPSLYSAAVGHHFARPGNRFWPALHRCSMTPRVLHPSEDRTLIEHGGGLTNLAARPTAKAAELSAQELREGGEILAEVARKHRPRMIAIVGITAYRQAFGRRHAQIGPQELRLGGADVWALPNPSGLNAHHQLDDLARLYGEMLDGVRGRRGLGTADDERAAP